MLKFVEQVHILDEDDVGLALASSDLTDARKITQIQETVRAVAGRLSALSVSHSESVLYGALVWARRGLNSQKRRFLARAEGPS
jgi:hypothetical protein